MKTELLKKSNYQVKNAMELLSEIEMKEIQGGITWKCIKDEDGNIRIVYFP